MNTLDVHTFIREFKIALKAREHVNAACKKKSHKLNLQFSRIRNSSVEAEK